VADEPQDAAGPICLFLSYARGDDEDFVRRLYEDLKARTDEAGRPRFRVWFDREDMKSRQLTFHHEIRTAVDACDRLILVIGPKAESSDYVRQEWQFAYFVANKCVNPIVRLDGEKPDGTRIDGYELTPQPLRKLHAEDFRDDARYEEHLEHLVRQLSAPPPPVGKLVAVPELPPGFRAQPERIEVLRDILLADLRKPVVVSGAAARVGVQGMGGIGKSVLASAMARHPEVRRSFKDGIYWIALGQRPEVTELQRRLSRELGGEGQFEGEMAGREELRTLIEHREMLLILDDVWDRGHAEAFNVIGPLGRILLTTRDSGLVTALACRENHYEVNLPTQAQAEDLLASAAGIDPGELPPEAKEIISKCGRLPLALALCGGMVQGAVVWGDVLEALRDHNLECLSTDHPAEQQHKNVWTAMNVSVRVLPEEERDRFAELAVFAMDTGAVDTAVATLWEHTGGLSRLEARSLLSAFERRSLVRATEVEKGEGARRRRIVLHDLVYNFATGMAVKRFGSEKALHERLVGAYRKKCPDGWVGGPNDGYFLQRLVHHLVALEDWEELIGDDDTPGVLTDLLFIQARCEAGMVHGLVADYNAALDALPEFREEREYLQEGDAAMRAYNKALNGYAVKRHEYLKAREEGRARAEPPYPEMPDILRDENRPAIPEATHPRAARLRHFANFVSGHMTVLSQFPGDTLPQAINWAKGSVAERAEQQIRESRFPYLERSNRPPTHPLRPQCLRTLQGHTSWVESLAVTPDGRRALSGSWDKTLRLWDLETGQCLAVYHAGDLVHTATFSPDGRRIVCGTHDGQMHFLTLVNFPPLSLEPPGDLC